MTTKPYQPSDAWRTFPPALQKRHIATELSRATTAGLHANDDLWRESLWRAMSLIDASLEDPQWSDKNFLFRLRDTVGSLYAGQDIHAVTQYLTEDLLRE